MFPACKSYDCMQTQVKAQESHAPITREQIKWTPSLLLESLCYKPVARSFQQRQRCLLKWPCEPPAKLVSSNKQSLQSSARHIASKPFSAHLIALAGLFDISCLSPATFSSAVPGDSPVTTDDKVNLFYTNYSCCFSHPWGEQWLFPSQELCWVSDIWLSAMSLGDGANPCDFQSISQQLTPVLWVWSSGYCGINNSHQSLYAS